MKNYLSKVFYCCNSTTYHEDLINSNIAPKPSNMNEENFVKKVI